MDYSQLIEVLVGRVFELSKTERYDLEDVALLAESVYERRNYERSYPVTENLINCLALAKIGPDFEGMLDFVCHFNATSSVHRFLADYVKAYGLSNDSEVVKLMGAIASVHNGGKELAGAILDAVDKADIRIEEQIRLELSLLAGRNYYASNLDEEALKSLLGLNGGVPGAFVLVIDFTGLGPEIDPTSLASENVGAWGGGGVLIDEASDALRTQMIDDLFVQGMRELFGDDAEIMTRDELVARFSGQADSKCFFDTGEQDDKIEPTLSRCVTCFLLEHCEMTIAREARRINKEFKSIEEREMPQ